MFVTSYSTYVSNSASHKIQKERVASLKESSSDFQTKLFSQKESSLVTPSSQKSQLPLNYISDYKVMNNQQKLQKGMQEESPSTKFSKINNQNSAKVAYIENSSLFSLRIKPKITLDQTPSIDTTLPPQVQEAQESLLKNIMISTYIANDNYYRVTA